MNDNFTCEDCGEFIEFPNPDHPDVCDECWEGMRLAIEDHISGIISRESQAIQSGISPTQRCLCTMGHPCSHMCPCAFAYGSGVCQRCPQPTREPPQSPPELPPASHHPDPLNPPPATGEWENYPFAPEDFKQ